MAALHRGFGLRLSLLGPRAPLPAKQQQQTFRPFSQRLFTTLSPLRYAQPVAPRAKPKRSPLKATPKAALPYEPTAPKNLYSADPVTHRLLQGLEAKGGPTLLYESGSHFWMKASAWAACTMFYSYAGINYYFTIVDPPPDLAAWIGPAWAVICVATAAFGSYFLLAVVNIVKSIRAVPTATVAKTLLPPGADARRTPVLLEIEVKRLLRAKPKTLLVAPSQVKIPHGVFAASRAHLTPAQQKALNASKVSAKEQWEHDKKHLMTVPFRHAGRGFKAAWFGIQRALTRTGFLKMKAGDANLKLDVQSGWALEDGLVLDGLLKAGNKKALP